MEPTNPFAAPGDGSAAQAELFANSPGLSVPSEVVTPLRETQPWVNLVGILTILAAGVCTLVAVLVALGAVPQLAAPFSLVYLLIAVLYVVPGVYLIRYSRSILKLIASNQLHDLSEALGMQRAFWRYVGIVCAVFLALNIGFIGLAFILGVVGALRG